MEREQCRNLGGRPSRFSPELGDRLVDLIGADLGRAEAARQAGISLRTLQTWMAAARDGDERFVDWRDRFVAAEAESDQKRRQADRERRRARDRIRWKRFKEAREAWYREQLGEAAFWTARLNWLLAKGCNSRFNQVVAQLRSQGFRIGSAP